MAKGGNIMITIDIMVPYSNCVYDFNLDDTVPISFLIEEITAMICAKEHWPALSSASGLALFYPGAKRMLDRSKSLADEGIITGQQLILC